MYMNLQRYCIFKDDFLIFGDIRMKRKLFSLGFFNEAGICESVT
jgi:hypothetical protein